MEKIDCIYSPACFPCIANRRIKEILETVEKKNRLPTDLEIEEAAMFQRSMMADIGERSRRRQNIIESIRLGVL